MGIHLILCFGSCLLALSITPLLRWIAVRKGILDYPTDERKIHEKAVPRVGGIAVVISFLVTMILGYLIFLPKSRESNLYMIGLCIGVVMISALGIWDDLQGLRARKKVIGQILTVLAIIPFGLCISGFSIPFVGYVHIGWALGISLTVFWVVGIINTVNFIDGVDGLAAGVAITISSALFAVTIATDQTFMAIACLVLTGSIFGFLRYNFHPATIFMGDCGAMFLGFALSVISIEVLFHNPRVVASSFVPVLIFGLPILDTTWAILRRLKKKLSPFHADGLHIHHRSIKLGLTQQRTVAVLYTASILSIVMGLIVALAGNDKMAIILSTLMLLVASVGIAVLNRASPAPRLSETQASSASLSSEQSITASGTDGRLF